MSELAHQIAEIEGVIERYFEGLHHADPERLGKVFHPQAIYATADETPPLIRDMPEYMSIVAKRQSPASLGAVRRDSIDSIELAGANTAFAKVRCVIAPRDFVDYLTLVRTDGRWQVIAKVFHFTEQTQAD